MNHLCFLSCVSHAVTSVHCCLVVTCWERADLLALVDGYCIFVTFPCGILGQVWYLIVSFPIYQIIKIYAFTEQFTPKYWERSCSVVECLTRDRGAAGSSLTGDTALWSEQDRFILT